MESIRELLAKKYLLQKEIEENENKAKEKQDELKKIKDQEEEDKLVLEFISSLQRYYRDENNLGICIQELRISSLKLIEIQNLIYIKKLDRQEVTEEEMISLWLIVEEVKKKLEYIIDNILRWKRQFKDYEQEYNLSISVLNDKGKNLLSDIITSPEKLKSNYTLDILEFKEILQSPGLFLLKNSNDFYIKTVISDLYELICEKAFNAINKIIEIGELEYEHFGNITKIKIGQEKDYKQEEEDIMDEYLNSSVLDEEFEEHQNNVSEISI